MTRFEDFLSRACAELGLRINLGFQVQLPSGKRVVSRVHIPNLSARQGVLLFTSLAELGEAREELEKEGYGVSIFGEPTPNEKFDVDGYAEMFAEWGWSGPKLDRPYWMTYFEDDTLSESPD